MGRASVVGQAVFDIGFGSLDLATRHQESLHRLITTDLIQVIDEVCRGATTADEIITLEELTLNLGRVDATNYLEELPRRLRAHLQSQLERTGPAEATAVGSARRIPRHLKIAEELRHFLVEGTMSWLQASELHQLESSFLELLRQQNDSFLRFLACSPGQENIARRIVYQMRPATITSLINALSDYLSALSLSPERGSASFPNAARKLRDRLIRLALTTQTPQAPSLPAQLYERLSTALRTGEAGPIRQQWSILISEFAVPLRILLLAQGQSQKLSNPIAQGFPEGMVQDLFHLLEPDHREFMHEVPLRPELYGHTDLGCGHDQLARKRVLWEFTLEFIFELRGSVFNRKSYLSNLVGQVAQRGQTSSYDLLQLMLNMVVELNAPQSLRRELQTYLQELLVETSPADTPPPSSIKNAQSSRQKELANILLQHQGEHLFTSWLEQKKTWDSGALRKALFDIAADEVSRRKLLQALSREMFREYLRLLVPTERDFIEYLTQIPLWFASKKTSPPQEEQKNQNHLRKITLEYLLIRRGSNFNRRAYVQHLITQMAIGQNMGQEEFLRSLCSGLHTFARKSPLHKELLTLLNTFLPQKSTTGIFEEGAPAADAPPPFLTGLSMIDQLEARLLFSGHDVFTKEKREVNPFMLQQLAHQEPALILDLLHRLQGKEWAIVCSEQPLDSELLHVLIDLLLQFIHQADSEKRALFQTSIKKWGQQAVNEPAFLARVLEQLNNNQPIDAPALLTEPLDLHSESGPEQADSPLGEKINEQQHPPEQQFLAALAHPCPDHDTLMLLQSIAQTLAQDPGWLATFITNHINEDNLARLLDLIPEHVLHTSFVLLFPVELDALAEFTRLLSFLPLLCTELSHRQLRLEKYRFLLTLTNRSQPLSITEAVQLFAGHLERKFQPYLKEKTLYGGLTKLLNNDQLASPLPEAVRSLCQTLSGKNIPQTMEHGAPPSASVEHIWSLDRKETHEESFWSNNAGLVLCSVYLPRLFAHFGMLAHNIFIDAQAQNRAVLLLQLLVTGNPVGSEPELILNKLLCGMPLDTPIPRLLDVDQSEIEVIEGLLQALISHWSALGATSIEGFRQSFLQREGIITYKKDHWHLLVEPRAFDLLLDQIPWGFTQIKHAWMELSIEVEWQHGL